MTTQDLLDYYSKLLIMQYQSKPKAYATIGALVNPVVMPQTSIQTVVFSSAPTSGTFVLTYGVLNSAAINWNDSTATIQGNLQAITGLGSVTVAGTIAELTLTITFTGVIPVATLLVASSNSLGVAITITETDVTLPIAVQNSFNLNTAVGVQLDVIAKYQGVTRYGNSFSGPITLSDDDLRTLIKFMIIKNTSNSSLDSIQSLVHNMFGNYVLVFDYTGMRMGYFLSSTIISTNLMQMLLKSNILPKPAGVQLGVTVYTPIVNQFFCMSTYIASGLGNPFNSYSSYITTWPWLSYANGIFL